MRADSIVRLHRSEAGAAFLTAQASAVGGPTWAVRRASTGDGLKTPITPAERTALISGWVYEYHPKTIVLDGATFQPDDEWRFVAVSGTAIQVGDELVSATDTAVPAIDPLDPPTVVRSYATTFSFTVLSVETRAGYLVAILEEVS